MFKLSKEEFGASVAKEAQLVMGVAKKNTKLKTVQRRIEHKELDVNISLNPATSSWKEG